MTDRCPLVFSTMLIVLFVAPLANAQTPPTPVPAQGSITKKPVDPRLDDQTIICKREETTGSRLGATKECHTRGEWRTLAAESRERTDRIENTPQISNSH